MGFSAERLRGIVIKYPAALAYPLARVQVGLGLAGLGGVGVWGGDRGPSTCLCVWWAEGVLGCPAGSLWTLAVHHPPPCLPSPCSALPPTPCCRRHCFRRAGQRGVAAGRGPHHPPAAHRAVEVHPRG